METNYLDILLIIVFLLNIIVFCSLKYDILEPAVLYNSTTLFSVLLAFLNKDVWNLRIGLFTFLMVVSSMISVSIGAIYVNRFSNNALKSRSVDQKMEIISNKSLIFICSVMLFFLYQNFNDLWKMSLELGNNEGIFNIIKTIRYPLERGDVVFSRWIVYRNIVAQVLGFLSVFLFLKIAVFKGIYKFQYLVPFILLIPFSLLTTGRSEFLFMIVYLVSSFSTLYMYKEQQSKIVKFKIFIVSSFVGCIFVFFFFLLGHLTGKVITDSRSPFFILSHYVGLSYPALDIFLNKPLLEDIYVGNNTFLGIYSNLKTLGFTIPEKNGLLEFTYFNGIDTNVYSVLRRYYTDFGFIGSNCFLMLIGIIYSYSYHYCLKNLGSITTSLYCMHIGTIIMAFHFSIPLGDIISSVFLYKIVLLNLAYICFVKKSYD